MAHIPSRPVGTETHQPEDLKGANALLAGQHQMDDAEPLAQGLICVLKNRACDVREAVVGARGRACVAEPVPGHRAVRFDFGIAATWAGNELRPTMLGEVEAASVFVGEGFFPLRDSHLVNSLGGLLVAGHRGISVDGPDYSDPRSKSKVRDNRPN